MIWLVEHRTVGTRYWWLNAFRTKREAVMFVGSLPPDYITKLSKWRKA